MGLILLQCELYFEQIDAQYPTPTQESVDEQNKLIKEMKAQLREQKKICDISPYSSSLGCYQSGDMPRVTSSILSHNTQYFWLIITIFVSITLIVFLIYRKKVAKNSKTVL